MIQIIKEGTKVITKCEKCGCEFSFDKKEDVVKIADSIRAGYKRTVVICPQCNNGVPVGEQIR